MEKRLPRRRFLCSSSIAGTTGLMGCTDILRNASESGTVDGETGTTEDDGIGEEIRSGDPEQVDPVRTVGAHYYPWYGGPVGDFREGEWSLESPSTPVLGNYNSTEPRVIAQHIDWCHTAGIRWLNVSWRGPNNIIDNRIENDIFEHPWADELDWSILYETGMRFADTPIDMDDPRNRQLLRDDFEYLTETYFHRDNYKYLDERPVLYIYNANSLHEVGDLIGAYEEAVEAAGIRPYTIADITNPTTFGSEELSEFADAVTIYNPYNPREDIEEVFFDRLEQSYRAWYLAQDHTDLATIPTVIPGFNDSEVTHVPRDNPVLESSPERYERVSEMTIRYAEGPVFVTSFNEWYENTQIEPSREHGGEYLEITADTLATGDRAPPTIEGETLSLVFERTIPEAEINPDLEHGRSLTVLCDRLRVSDHEGTRVVEVDVGGEENDLLFLMGTYEQGRFESDTWRWFGGSRKTVIHLPELPERGSLEIEGRAAAEMAVTVVVNDEVRGEGTVGTQRDTYVVDYE